MFYHAHIYWRNEEEHEHAKRIKEWFQRASCAVGEDTDGAIKPHPLPRYEVTYDIGNQQVVEMFLEQCRHECVIFSHKITGDSVKDYQEGKWLGEVLEIDYEWLAVNPEFEDK